MQMNNELIIFLSREVEGSPEDTSATAVFWQGANSSKLVNDLEDKGIYLSNRESSSYQEEGSFCRLNPRKSMGLVNF